MTNHDLKIHPDPFARVLDGRKTYEVRADDRGYAVGDTLTLKEWVPASAPPRDEDSCENCGYSSRAHPGGAGCLVGRAGCDRFVEPGDYTGRTINVVVTDKTPGGEEGLPPNLCVLGIRKVAADDARIFALRAARRLLQDVNVEDMFGRPIPLKLPDLDGLGEVTKALLDDVVAIIDEYARFHAPPPACAPDPVKAKLLEALNAFGNDFAPPPIDFHPSFRDAYDRKLVTLRAAIAEAEKEAQP